MSKADEFLRAAQDSLALGNHSAVTGNAVHAGISAADAIAAATLGAVWIGEHGSAAGHVEQAGTTGKEAANQLRRLLPLKNRAEYDPRPVATAEARTAVKAAERLVGLARQAAGRPARPPA